MRKGLFVGLSTLDLIYLAEDPPKRNEKIVAIDSAIAAGGPATNAAVTFAYLGNESILASAIGLHPTAQLIRSDLEVWQVKPRDLDPDRTTSPPVSSIVVTESTGDRAVVCLNAVKAQLPADRLPVEILNDVSVVLIDGHQMEISASIAQAAREVGIPVVIDGGSWKPGLETVLPFVDYAICSANFCPPECDTIAQVMDFLMSFGIRSMAVTRGGEAIGFRVTTIDETLGEMQVEDGEVAVPIVTVVDTLGAGDIFHGAFCHFILECNFQTALSEAAKVAARACRSFGTRDWMRE